MEVQKRFRILVPSVSDFFISFLREIILFWREIISFLRESISFERDNISFKREKRGYMYALELKSVIWS